YLNCSAHLLRTQTTFDESVENAIYHEVREAEIDVPIANIDLRSPQSRIGPPADAVSFQPSDNLRGGDAEQMRCLCRCIQANADEVACDHGLTPARKCIFRDFDPVNKATPRRACIAGSAGCLCLEVIYRIAQRPIGRSVVLAKHGDAAGAVLDSGSVGGERHDRTTLQQPDQAGRVIAGQAAVARVWLLRRRVQSKQVTRVPAECFGLLAPSMQKGSAVRHALPPAGDVDQGREPQLEVSESPAIAQPRCRKLHDLDTAAVAVRLGRGRLIGCARLSRFGPRQELSALLMDQGVAQVPDVASGTAHRTKRVFSQTFFVCCKPVCGCYGLIFIGKSGVTT